MAPFMHEVAAAALAVDAATPTPAVTLASDDAPQGLAALVRGRVLAGAPELPAMPPLAAAVLRIAVRPSYFLTAALDVLRRDQRLSSLLIRLASVEPYGAPVPATSLDQAVGRLGAQGLCLGLIELAAQPVVDNRNPRIQLLFRRPWQHALAVAFVARRLALLAVPDAEPAHAYAAGLLRDIGRPLVAGLVADTERRTWGLGSARPPTEATWLECIDASHAVVRARLADAWRLPGPVVQALGPHDAAPPATALGATVQLAGLLADLAGFHLRAEDPARADELLPAARAALGADEELVRRATDGVAEWVQSRG
jgi:HD-like signal output (HDOD) protein